MDFVRAIERALGVKAQIELAPMQPGDVQATYASTDKLRAEIGYAPATPIDGGRRALRRLVQDVLETLGV